jgi:hypothetical protein
MAAQRQRKRLLGLLPIGEKLEKQIPGFEAILLCV